MENEQARPDKESMTRRIGHKGKGKKRTFSSAQVGVLGGAGGGGGVTGRGGSRDDNGRPGCRAFASVDIVDHPEDGVEREVRKEGVKLVQRSLVHLSSNYVSEKGQTHPLRRWFELLRCVCRIVCVQACVASCA